MGIGFGERDLASSHAPVLDMGVTWIFEIQFTWNNFQFTFQLSWNYFFSTRLKNFWLTFVDIQQE